MDTAIILAAIPVLAFVINFAYEAGFAKRLGIPPSFISLNFIDVLNNIIPITYAFAFTATLFTIILFFRLNNKVWYGLIVLLSILVIQFCDNLGFLKWVKIVTVGIFIIFIIIFVFNNIETLQQHTKVNHKIVTGVILFLISIFIVSYYQGCRKSKIQNLYSVLYNQEEMNEETIECQKIQVKEQKEKCKRVVLRSYGNMLVCSDIFPDEKNEYKAINNYVIDELINPGNKLVLEQIGPLEVNKANQ